MNNLLEQPLIASDSEKSQLKQVGQVLGHSANKGNSRAKLVTPDGSVIELPDLVYRLLQSIVASLLAGRAITLLTLGRSLTTQQAADILNVSRPYLTRLLEQGEIPYRKVGTHRRIEFEDLMNYKAKADSDSDTALSRLAELSQEYGLEL